MDFSTAFLNGKLEEEVYMRQTPGFEKKNSRGQPLIMQLHKSIYGLRLSPKAWNSTIDDLRALGFKPNVSNACVYVKGTGDDYIILSLYVDDLLITGPNSAIVAKILETLMDKFSMIDFGDATRILGIDIIQDKQLGTDDTPDYQSIVGSLISLYPCTRVNICFVASQATRFMGKAT
ncbi:unnamed protein product [Sphacelaria rigidula]